MFRAVIVSMRPRQWIKNVLVGAAPLAAGTVLEGEAATRTGLAFVAFCLASSAIYLVNDVCDGDLDRQHARKRSRPIAAGELSTRTALGVAVLLAIGAVAIGGPNPLRLVLLTYLGLSIGYCVRLKREPVIELGLVASGFLLRAVAGGPATGIPLSRWFLIVAGFGSLFIVVGKRLSEIADRDDTIPTRPVLALYAVSYLRLVLGVAVSVTLTAYGLWAFEVGTVRAGSPWPAISVAPFVVAMLRYAWHVDGHRAEDPEHILLHDHALQVLIVAWLVTFSASALH